MPTTRRSFERATGSYRPGSAGCRRSPGRGRSDPFSPRRGWRLAWPRFSARRWGIRAASTWDAVAGRVGDPVEDSLPLRSVRGRRRTHAGARRHGEREELHAQLSAGSALQYSPRVLILDLGGSYRWLTSFLGGATWSCRHRKSRIMLSVCGPSRCPPRSAPTSFSPGGSPGCCESGEER